MSGQWSTLVVVPRAIPAREIWPVLGSIWVSRLATVLKSTQVVGTDSWAELNIS